MSLTVVDQGLLGTYAQYTGFKNRIINGDMRIDQRNAGAAVNTDGAFPVDRWKQNMSGGGVISGQRSTVVPAGFVNSLSQTVSTADSSIAAGDYYYLTQNIEGFNVSDLGWGTASAQSITVSFQVRSSVTGTYAVAFGNSAFNRLYVATYTVNAANTWETKTVTIAGDTSGTWLTDNGIGLRVYFDLGSGSAYNASSSGAWLGSGVGIRVSGSVNWISNSGATFYITGVQLEAGSTATSFDRRDYGRELMMCQRYYYQIDGSNSPYSIVGVSGGTDFIFTYWNAVTMRASPTGGFTGAFQLFYFPTAGGTQTVLTITSGVSAFTIQPSVNGGRFYTTRSVGQGGLATWADIAGSTAKFTLSAEL